MQTEFDVSKTINRLCAERNWSLAQMALKAGISRSNLSERMAGNNLTKALIARINTALEIDLTKELIKDIMPDLTMASAPPTNEHKVTFTLTNDEIKELMLFRSRTDEEMKNELKKMAAEMRTVIEEELRNQLDKEKSE